MRTSQKPPQRPRQQLPASSLAVQQKRAFCDDCGRPQRVCICFALPGTPLPNATPVVILQTLAESKAKVKTADLLPRCIDNVQVMRATKDALATISPDAVLLYPGSHTVPLNELQRVTSFVLLDGTWKGARRMLEKSPFLQSLPRASLPKQFMYPSLFKVRKPPTTLINGARSTAEAVASALECVGGNEGGECATVIRKAVHEASEIQLQFVRKNGELNCRHRTERRGYVHGLYSRLAERQEDGAA